MLRWNSFRAASARSWRTSIVQALQQRQEQRNLQMLIEAAQQNKVERASDLFCRWILNQEGGDPSGKALLGLNKWGFTHDFLFAFARQPGWQCDLLRRKTLRALSSVFLPCHLDDNNYLDPAHNAADSKRRLRDFLRLLWKEVQKERSYAAVATGNFGYFEEREFAAAVHERGAAFIALHKENLKSPGLAQFWQRVYRERRGHFGGTGILTYNQIEKEIQVAAGVAEESRIKVTGMPRLDAAHQIRSEARAAEKPPTLLAFSFSERVGLPFIERLVHNPKPRWVVDESFDGRSAMRWTRLWRDYHTTLVDFARNHPKYAVVLKTKVLVEQAANLREFVATQSPLPANFHIVQKGDPLELIRASQTVCGFNSTALLEGLAAGRPVVTAAFGEARQEEYMPFVVDLQPAAQSAGTVTQFQDLLEHCLKADCPHTVLQKEVQQVLQHWAGNPDGQSCDRVRRAFCDMIQQQGT